MTKTKIAFAGFMGAILMSVGAANAVTTSVATKGYVDQEIGKVQENAVTINDVTTAINNSVNNLDNTYELLSHKVLSLTKNFTATEKDTLYPSVGAVLDQLSKVGLSDADRQLIENLTGEDGLITRVTKVESAVETLTGEGTDSVAGQIASAITAHNTVAGNTYQAKSTDAYSMGNAQGGWTALEDDEVAALTSGITAEKIATYDALAGDDGTIAEIRTTINDLDADINDAENGLKIIVAENASDIADNASAIAKNAEDIATNTAALANKITMPAACTAENATCVLMSSNGTITWTPVTSPVED